MSAMAAEDYATAATWVDVLRAEPCDAESGLTQLERQLRSLQCAAWAREVDRIDGRLAALGAGPALGWRAQLEAVAWTCRLAHPDTEKGRRERAGRARSGAWTWDAWPDADVLIACIDREMGAIDAPAHDLDLQLIIER
jgi:hypothetical protein